MNKAAIIGMGALGIMYGAHIKDNGGGMEPEYVMDINRAEKYRNKSFSVNGKEYRFVVAEAENAGFADLVILAVKYPGLKASLDVMKNCIGPNTIILSVMNGVSSERLIMERYPDAHVIYCVAQGMDCMKIGDKVSYSKMGELHIGKTGADA